MSATHRVCAIVVTYQPDIDHLAECLNALSNQVSAIVLVANSVLSIPDRLTSSFCRVDKLHVNAENVGIAAAQNQGLVFCRELGAEFVLFMDDDSQPTDQMVDRLLDVITDAGARDVAAVGPGLIDLRTGHRSFFVVESGVEKTIQVQRSGSDPVDVVFLISSGTLCRFEALAHIGGMRSAYFIDHVDTEWCLRCRSLGYRLIGVPWALLGHRLGDEVSRVWLWRWRRVSRHSAVRHYYMFRNTIFLIRDLKMRGAQRRHFLWRLVQFFCFFMLVGTGRIQRMNLMFYGCWHGIKGIGGRFETGTRTCRPVATNEYDPSLCREQSRREGDLAGRSG
jgi:rhamnosyltransferase